ncbi:MAG: flavodoxin-dependent (E)-4-hydroxy-3-methylbut-2-enyl-diphosphate synthase, partial [Clostridiales bacterium]|nr:flavodoxin-dependent (E)-4-hydroxy-3-methylbut-2-enyl-diphosphate synthase [Clostridiales bacterium]
MKCNIVAQVRRDGYQTAIVADIHFVPEIASIAADSVDKVRINPGNYRTSGGELEA